MKSVFTIQAQQIKEGNCSANAEGEEGRALRLMTKQFSGEMLSACSTPCSLFKCL